MDVTCKHHACAGDCSGLISSTASDGGFPGYLDLKSALALAPAPGPLPLATGTTPSSTGSSDAGAITGGVVGGVAAVLVVGLAVFAACHLQAQKKQNHAIPPQNPWAPQTVRPRGMNAVHCSSALEIGPCSPCWLS